MRITKSKILILSIVAIFLFFPSLNFLTAEELPINPALLIISVANPSFVPILVGQNVLSLIGDIAPSTDEMSASIVMGMLNVLLGFLAMLSSFLLTLGQSVLNFVLSPDFISISATDFNPDSSTYNIVVALGWGIVRNIANAALVIGLVIIAISIILGQQENTAKKTLINFILIALLINFTPVICGFLIDSSNVIMNSFLTGGINDGYIKTIENSLMDPVKGLKDKDPFTMVGATLSITVFALIGFVIYLLYALLFAARYLILWILVIVSPIAFATKVFPKSIYIKKIFPSVTYWDDWWENFLQWCVIGIPAGMSIYLSNMLIAGTAQAAQSAPNFIEALVFFIIPLVFLVAGFFISISSGGPVGSFVGGLATGARALGAGKGIAGKAWDKTAGWAGDRAGAVGTWAKEGVTGRIGGAISNLAGNEKIDTGTKEGREAGRYKFREYTKMPREIATKYGLASPTMIGKKSKTEVAAEEFAKNVDFEDYEKYRERYSQPQRTAIEKKLANEDLSKFLKGGTSSSAEYQRRIASIINNGNEKQKVAAYMHASGNQNLVGGSAGLSNFINQSKIEDIGKSIRKISAKEAREKITAEAIENNPIILQNLGSKQAINIMREGSEEQKRALKEAVLDPTKNKPFIDHIAQQINIINTSANPNEIAEAKAVKERAMSLSREVWKNK